jgi:DDE superfamily endonuclease
VLRADGAEQGWAFDEGRFGLKIWLRRRWCPDGERPPWVYEDRYAWWWLYAAVRPQTGERCCLPLPEVDAACFQAFLAAFGAQLTGRRVGLVPDGASAHRSGEVRWPAGIVPLPPYSPELNPAERRFEHLRRRLSNRVFTDLDELAAAITAELSAFWEEPHTLTSLVAYPWWVDAVRDIEPRAS